MLIPRKYQSIVVATILLIISLTILSYSAVRLSETGFLRKIVLETAAPVQDAINVSLKSLHDAWNRYLFLVGLEEENRRLRRDKADIERDSATVNTFVEKHGITEALGPLAPFLILACGGGLILLLDSLGRLVKVPTNEVPASLQPPARIDLTNQTPVPVRGASQPADR